MKKTLLPIICLFLFSQCNTEKEFVEPKATETRIGDTEYEERPDMLHYVVLITTEDIDLMERKTEVGKFNDENGFPKLRMNNIYLPDENKKRNPIVAIRRFKNFKEAKKYIRAIEKKNFLRESERIYAFSQDNYRRLLVKKNFAEYEDFYRTID